MNEMTLTNFTIGEESFGNENQFNDFIINNVKFYNDKKKREPKLRNFLYFLALCH